MGPKKRVCSEPCREQRTQSTMAKVLYLAQKFLPGSKHPSPPPPHFPKVENEPQSDSSSFSSKNFYPSFCFFVYFFLTLSLLNASKLRSCSSLLPLASNSSQVAPKTHTQQQSVLKKKKKRPLANLIQSQKHRFLPTA